MLPNTTPTLAGRSGPDVALLARQWVELSERMAICSRQLRNLISQHCDRGNLSDPQLSLLWACLMTPPGGIGQRDLAQLLVVSPAHISEVLEQLRRQGFLEGRRNLHDRRRQHWQVTPAGQARIRLLLEHLAGWALQLESQFHPADLLSPLHHLMTALLDSPAAGGEGLEPFDGSRMTESSGMAPAPQRGAA